MKYYLFIIILLPGFFQSYRLQAQIGQTIHVSGQHILGPCGDTLLLRGVNYAPYNWGWSPLQLNITQIALSGANAVRLVWYKNPTGTTPISTYNNLINLDSALSKCVQQKMVPIIDLHDQTCQNNHAALIALAIWYTQPSVLALINKYKHSLILNIANEALFVNWTANPTTAQTQFVSTYSTIINNLRNAGITLPLMIDAPECGTNLNVLANVGNTLQLNDPQHNLIFSAHAYWYSYASNDSLQMLNIINNALAQNIPFLFGEIANTQDDASMCQYALNYKALLNICKTKKIGWLAWSWDNDGCASRQITSNGNFSNLTLYGNEIINNPQFGLLNYTPLKSQYLVNNGSCNVNVKAFLSGYYTNSLSMRNVLFDQQLISIPSDQTDTMILSLHQAANPFAKVYETKWILRKNGWLNTKIPLAFMGQNYYLALKHRNTIQTWSSSPVLLNGNVSYDFTSANSKAFGNNQTELEPGVFGFYTADINQDDNIDLSDYALLDISISQFQYGYQTSDLNGDGSVDLGDIPLLENNLNQFIFSIHP